MSLHNHNVGNWSLRVETAPTEEPVTLAEAKLQLRVDTTADDVLITSLIVQARELLEKDTKRTFTTTVLRLTMDFFPGHFSRNHNFHNFGFGFHNGHDNNGISSLEISLASPPIQSVTTVKHFDIDGVQQTLVESTDYQVDIENEPGRIVPAIGKDWPDTEGERLNSVEVIYKAGYGAAAAVPQALKQAILWLVGTAYDLRSDTTDCAVNELPKGVDRIIGNYRIWEAA